MRLRNVPGSREAIAEHPLCILEENPQAGNWHTVFGNNHPIHIEVGMGKGPVYHNTGTAESGNQLYRY